MSSITCHDCGLQQRLPPIPEGTRASCVQCNRSLFSNHRDGLNRLLGYSFSGVVLLFLSLAFPFMSLVANGQQQTMSLFSGVMDIWLQGYPFLSIIVAISIFCLPAVILLQIIYLLLPVKLGFKPPKGSQIFYRLLEKLITWSMAEVFLIGVLVSLVKLASLADIIPGLSFWAYCGFSICLVMVLATLDKHQLDGWLQHQIHRHHTERPVNRSKSLNFCGALLLTACILYIPANFLPITTTHFFGQQDDSTILGGIITLWQLGSYPVACVIFIASIVVPIAKILSLTYLCLSVRFSNQRRRHQRTTIYRITEIVGRWSMIDVFVVAILVSLVQFGGLLAFNPGPAAMAFCAVVVLTMLAAESFDPRMIWDETSKNSSDKQNKENSV